MGEKSRVSCGGGRRITAIRCEKKIARCFFAAGFNSLKFKEEAKTIVYILHMAMFYAKTYCDMLMKIRMSIHNEIRNAETRLTKQKLHAILLKMQKAGYCMELNPDCVQRIMLFLEEHLRIHQIGESDVYEFDKIQVRDLQNWLAPEFDKEEVAYAALNLAEQGYIKAFLPKLKNGHTQIVNISDITWEGHEFLGCMKNDDIWTEVKSKAKKLGAITVGVLASVSKMVFEERIKALFG